MLRGPTLSWDNQIYGTTASYKKFPKFYPKNILVDKSFDVELRLDFMQLNVSNTDSGSNLRT